MDPSEPSLVEQKESPHLFSSPDRLHSSILPLWLLAAGFLVRIANSAFRFLNPDEALHYLLSVRLSLAAAWRASLTTAHPPLLILFLHYWGMLGHSESFLRIPSIVAGTGFCWIMFCWLRRVMDYSTALIALILFLFSPVMIILSGEVRQYALLLFFCAGSLYFLDRGFQEDSRRMMLFSSLMLYFALSTHYAALIFAFTLGVYALLRFISSTSNSRLLIPWIAGQLGALALVAFLLIHHIPELKARSVAEVVSGSYLRRSYFQPGEEHYLTFVVRANLRLFHYFFSQGAVGAAALGLFAWGVFLIVRKRKVAIDSKLRSAHQLAFLFIFPLLLNCALGMLRIYPFGGSRHNSYLAIFTFPAIALALAQLNLRQKWWKPVALGLVLAACNFFGSPMGEYLRSRDQDRRLMTKATASLASLPGGSTILTDDQGGLMLSYYLCHDRVVQIEEHPFKPFMRAACGSSSVISINPDDWIFKADSFAYTFRAAQDTYGLKPGMPLWIFQSGWFVDKESQLREDLKQYGCRLPQNFGRNMYICQLTVNANSRGGTLP